MSRLKFRTTNEGRVVRDAMARGWLVVERNGQKHLRLQWPRTGVVYTIPSSMDDGFAKRIRRTLERLEKEGA